MRTPQERKLRTAKTGLQYGEEKSGASKSTGKAGDQPQRVEGGPEIPPEENPPPPENPTPGTSKDPTPGTSKDPTDAPPAVPTLDPAQDPTATKAKQVEVETPPELTAYVKSYLTAYVKSYKLSGKNWLETVLDQKEQAYDTLYDRLVKIGAPHKEFLDQAVRQQVFASIKNRSGKCLSEDNFTMYVEQAEIPKKQRYRFTDDDVKGALKDYYDAVDTLREAQANLAHSTKVLEEKIEDKTVFLDIIRQMQFPAVQVSVRTIEEEEQLKNMTYRDVTSHKHLPDFRRLNPNATEQTTTLAALCTLSCMSKLQGSKHHRWAVQPSSDARQHHSRDW